MKEKKKKKTTKKKEDKTATEPKQEEKRVEALYLPDAGDDCAGERGGTPAAEKNSGIGIPV